MHADSESDTGLRDASGRFPIGVKLRRVVAKGRRLDMTPLADVATSPTTVAYADTQCEKALALMVENHSATDGMPSSRMSLAESARS